MGRVLIECMLEGRCERRSHLPSSIHYKKSRVALLLCPQDASDCHWFHSLELKMGLLKACIDHLLAYLLSFLLMYWTYFRLTCMMSPQDAYSGYREDRLHTFFYYTIPERLSLASGPLARCILLRDGEPAVI